MSHAGDLFDAHQRARFMRSTPRGGCARTRGSGCCIPTS